MHRYRLTATMPIEWNLAKLWAQCGSTPHHPTRASPGWWMLRCECCDGNNRTTHDTRHAFEWYTFKWCSKFPFLCRQSAKNFHFTRNERCWRFEIPRCWFPCKKNRINIGWCCWWAGNHFHYYYSHFSGAFASASRRYHISRKKIAFPSFQIVVQPTWQSTRAHYFIWLNWNQSTFTQISSFLLIELSAILHTQ